MSRRQILLIIVLIILVVAGWAFWHGMQPDMSDRISATHGKEIDNLAAVEANADKAVRESVALASSFASTDAALMGP
jgi:predicted negative regulator of RcsB-dependent stress response